ncbi:MAG: glycosyltransferase family 4 protein [Thermoleophilaceae bacterium]
MRVQLVDPSAYTPPYDHALAAGLVRAGAEVELVTSRFVHGVRPPAEGFAVSERFYRRATAQEAGRNARRLVRAAEHVPDMLRYRSHAAAADVRHFQWLALEPLDSLLLAPDRPRVFTVHNTLRRGEGRARKLATRRLIERMDALVVHAHAGARELIERFGADPAKVRVIPHGAFDYLTRQTREESLPEELRDVEVPVILLFGLVRPYKGADLLLEAFTGLESEAELWVVGLPHVDMTPLRAAAARARGTVRFVERYVTEAEIPAFFRRADVVVLPYRRIDQSGVLYTALAFAKALVLSDVGGFGEVGREHGAARLVPPEDPAALREALDCLLCDPAEREALGARAAAAAAGPFSWDDIARRTLALYEELVG